MLQADFERFRNVLAGMAELFKTELSTVLLDAYWLALREWPLDEFEQAAGHLMGSEEFMPRPVKFNQLRKAHLPTAGEAFAAAVSHAASGAWRRGDSGDASVDRAVRAIGGYVVIAMCEEEKLPFLERRFSEHFETMADADEVRGALPDFSPRHQRIGGPRSLAALVSELADSDSWKDQ